LVAFVTNRPSIKYVCVDVVTGNDVHSLSALMPKKVIAAASALNKHMYMLCCAMLCCCLLMCRTLAELPSDSIHSYIISMTRTASDVLSVVLLMRECGMEDPLRGEGGTQAQGLGARPSGGPRGRAGGGGEYVVLLLTEPDIRAGVVCGAAVDGARHNGGSGMWCCC
jgi:hypothetical protein